MKAEDPHTQIQVTATEHPTDSITGINRRQTSIKRHPHWREKWRLIENDTTANNNNNDDDDDDDEDNDEFYYLEENSLLQYLFTLFAKI